MEPLLIRLREFNPALRVIFTVSPVRHWKDGAVDNQLSKSVLHVAIHSLLNRHEGLFYFPSYEIFMDELRDYRFYAADMLHPSEQGCDLYGNGSAKPGSTSHQKDRPVWQPS